ncbi:MAG: MBL fold metallo-hydrolase [bacterium]|nr:MBL fold metallo-hydrolase [bacterium]
MSATFLPIGTTDEIGDACYLLTLNGTTLMLDAGVHPQKEGWKSIPEFHLAEGRDIDAILISHCHLDHLGALPIALAHFPHASVLMSEASAVLAPVMLHHTASVMHRRQADGASEAPLYTHDQIDLIDYVFQGMKPHQPFPVFNLDKWDNDLQAQFFDAGHILGASGIWIQGPETTVFYTGDTAYHEQEILPGAKYPEGLVDVLITESTLGADPSAENNRRKDVVQHFARSITEVVQRDGNVLIPAFSLGRTQEMLATLHRLRNEDQIPDVDIYTAGFGDVVSNLYDRTVKYTRRRDPDLRLKNLDILSLPPGDVRRGAHLSRPSIILVSSGMMTEGTMSYRLAEVMLPDPRHGIFFVGYVDPDMPGYQILAHKNEETLQLVPEGPDIPVECTVQRFHFSAHSHRRHLLHLVDRLSPRQVILIHGERGAEGWLRESIQNQHPEIDVVIGEKGREISIG